MSEKKSKPQKPAVLFGAKNVIKVGYIDEYIFACEIKGEDHIVYSKPRKPKYHLVIIVLEGNIEIIINGEKFRFPLGLLPAQRRLLLRQTLWGASSRLLPTSGPVPTTRASTQPTHTPALDVG